MTTSPLSPTVAAILLIAAPIISIGIVKHWRAPRGLTTASFVTIPLVGSAAGVLALVAEIALVPEGLKQSVADISLLAVLAAVVEEIAKTLALVWLLHRRRATLTSTPRGVAAGLLIGLGFGLFENVGRAFMVATRGCTLMDCIARAGISTPGHAAYTGLVAWMIARRRIENERVGGLALGLVAGITTHFLFDAVGLFPQLVDHAMPVEIACRSTQALIVYASLARIVWPSRSCSVTELPFKVDPARAPVVHQCPLLSRGAE